MICLVWVLLISNGEDYTPEYLLKQGESLMWALDIIVN